MMNRRALLGYILLAQAALSIGGSAFAPARAADQALKVFGPGGPAPAIKKDRQVIPGQNRDRSSCYGRTIKQMD